MYLSVFVCENAECDRWPFHHTQLLNIDPGKAGGSFPLCAVYDLWKLLGILWPQCRRRMFAHHAHLIYVMMQSYMKAPNIWNTGPTWSADCEATIMPTFAIIFYALYGAVYFRLTHYPFGDCWNVIHIVIIIKSELWIFSHCLVLGNETTLCAAWLAIFS